MALQLFTKDNFDAIQAAGLQGSSDRAVPVDVTEGSVPLAMLEGNSAALLFLQAQIIVVLALTRAATSNDDDLDTWFADFGFDRLPAKFATGLAALNRTTALSTVYIPADGSAALLLSDASQYYTIIPDVTNAAYDATNTRYVMAPGVTSLNVAIQAVTAGTAANVAVGTELLSGQNVTNIEFATVYSGLDNGAAKETDAAYRVRFPLYLAGLARSTEEAIESAIANVQTGIDYTIWNNSDPIGNFEPGNFIVTIDDGSGNPPDALVRAVDAAVTAYQGATISHNVRKPTIDYLHVTLFITVKSGYDPAQVAPLVDAAITAYINALKLGVPLSLTYISVLAYAASAGVANVVNVQINGIPQDYTIATNHIIRLDNTGVVVSY